MPDTAIQTISGRASSGDTDSPVVADKEKDYYDYSGYACGVFTRLLDGWNQISAETDRQRAVRYVKDADSLNLRLAGILKADEIYTPVRLIDSNIRAEQPASITYMTQSRRAIIFAPKDAVPVNGLEKLEADFTNKSRYLGWEIPHIKCDDGCGAHGWDSVELIFDTNAPGHFVFEHIGHDCLIFSTDCEDLEAQEVIAIKKNLTAKQLRTMIPKGFSADQVDKLVGLNQKATNSVDCNIECFKFFFKLDNTVHVCWHGRNCDEFLCPPEPLYMGMHNFTAPKELVNPNDPTDISQDYPSIYEESYPIVPMFYVISNDPCITQIPGRVKLDEPSQEAASAIQSGIVNGTLRAQNIYACVSKDGLDQNNAAPAQTNTPLTNGGIYDKKLDFFRTPMPDAGSVQILQAVVTQNKQEQGGGINYSVLNRKDSGKTATEVQAATAAKTELSSVQVILRSIYVRLCYAKAWRLYQNRVLQGAIIIRDTNLLQLFGTGIKIDPRGAVSKCTGATQYILKSSGDVDVIQRQERLQRLLQGWPVFGKTALAPEYLKDIVRFSFPEDADRYIAVLDQAAASENMQLKTLLGKVSQVAAALAIDPHTGQMRADITGEAPRLQQLQQEVTAALSNSTEGETGPTSGNNNQPLQLAEHN